MYKAFKRCFDIAVSFIIGLILSPVLIIISVSVKLTSKGSVFFRQKRVGRNGTTFEMLKFRSMRTDAPKDMPTHLLKDPYAYITPLGRFLRKSSLDELPQLLNIFKGDMSFIGPRPALWNQDDLIAERGKQGADAIRPGLTGWAQVNGNKNLSVRQKAEFDGEYARKMSLGMDAAIVFGTVYCLVTGYGMQEGASDKNTGK